MGNYTRLSMRERCNLNIFLQMGLSINQIAKRLGRHRSTVYRELARNSVKNHYRPAVADQKARKRKSAKPLKLTTDKQLYHYVYDRLRQGWSPEQIVGRMRLERRPFLLCHETIYRYVYAQGKKHLWQYLPSQRKKRRKRKARSRSGCRYGQIRLITQRPKSIEKRTRFGHWEGDLIAFSGNRKKTVTTLVERKSRMLMMIKNVTKTSEVVMGSLGKKLKRGCQAQRVPSCHSIAFDQGVEFANYALVEGMLGCKVYYCQAHSPWQKGSNENMNGRLRRYLPRKLDVEQLTQRQLDQLAWRMNNVPRKCLGFRTPKELYLKHIRNKCRTKT